MEKVQKTLRDLYKSNRENALDEAMITFDGRSRLQVLCRADSHDGYMCEF